MIACCLSNLGIFVENEDRRKSSTVVLSINDSIPQGNLVRGGYMMTPNSALHAVCDNGSNNTVHVDPVHTTNI